MAEHPVEKRSRRRFFGIVFGRRGLWSKKCPSDNNDKSTTTTTTTSSNNNVSTSSATTPNIQFTKSPGTEFNPRKVQEYKVIPESIEIQRPISKPSSNQGQVQEQARKVPKEAISLSGELESMIIDNQKPKRSNGSSSNVMLFGNLGNLNHTTVQNNGYNNNTGGVNEVRKTQDRPVGWTGNEKMMEEERRTSVTPSQDQPETLCRAISTRMDPETLKIMGNEDYKSGNYAEALALYEAAIAIDPKKAAYRSNKSAALTAMGRILEAVLECKEAIRIEPRYHRAHHRLGNLYLRLGEVEKSIYHFKHAGPEADQEDISKAKMVQTHLNKCTEAKRLRDWNSLIKETKETIVTGADAAPQVFALQAEAFLRTYRHQEADDVLSRCPVFNVEMSTKYYGPTGYAGFLLVWAQVHMASGRFGEAVEAIQRAGKLDGNNREVSMVLQRVMAVTKARSRGNDYFKAGRFQEACAAYGEGLNHDSRNSVLLCNRAACLSKMGQYDRAVEDSTMALTVRPGYTKGRLRRADCNSKLGNWELAIEDYEILRREMPEDEEVIRGLTVAQSQLMKRQGP